MLYICLCHVSGIQGKKKIAHDNLKLNSTTTHVTFNSHHVPSCELGWSQKNSIVVFFFFELLSFSFYTLLHQLNSTTICFHGLTFNGFLIILLVWGDTLILDHRLIKTSKGWYIYNILFICYSFFVYLFLINSCSFCGRRFSVPKLRGF